MVEYGHKIEGEVNDIKREIKKVYREPTVKRRKPGLRPKIWNRRKK